MWRGGLWISLSGDARAVSFSTALPVSRLVVSAWSCLFLSFSSLSFLLLKSASLFDASLPDAELPAIRFTSMNAIFESAGNGRGGFGAGAVVAGGGAGGNCGVVAARGRGWAEPGR